MGCTPSQRRDLRTIEKRQTKVGNLKITVTGGQFYETAKEFKTMKNPIFKVQISNQVFSTAPTIKIQQKSPANETFTFWINSMYKGNGRFIEIQLHDSDVNNAIKAYGIVDLDGLLNKPGVEHQIKVIMEHKNNPIGFMNLKAIFSDGGFEKLCFRFENCTLRRKTRVLGEMNVSVRVTIGEQVLQTQKKKDTKQQSVSWHESVMQFLAPKQIKQGLVEVYDQKKLVGTYKLNMEAILKEREGDEIMHVEDLHFMQENAGTIKFSVISGQKGNFALFTQKLQKSTIVLNRSKNEVEKP